MFRFRPLLFMVSMHWLKHDSLSGSSTTDRFWITANTFCRLSTVLKPTSPSTYFNSYIRAHLFFSQSYLQWIFHSLPPCISLTISKSDSLLFIFVNVTVINSQNLHQLAARRRTSIFSFCAVPDSNLSNVQAAIRKKFRPIPEVWS